MNSQERESISPEIHVDYQSNSLPLDSCGVDRFKMLNIHRSTLNSAAARRYKRQKRCGTSGFLKKRSQSSYQEPSTIKFAGATEPSSRNPSSPSSRRTSVCNCKSSDNSCFQDLSNTNKALNELSNSPIFKNSDDNLQKPHSQVSSIAGSVPQVPPPLFRSFSDPISSDHQLAEFTTPLLRSRSSDQEIPNSKKLKKFKQKMEDLWQWMREFMHEEDEDTTHLQNNGIINNNCKEEVESENQEIVCVKKTEEGLTLHFKCPCGGGYEVFLCGDKCFYRLT